MMRHIILISMVFNMIVLFSQKRVGINVSNPQAALHVADSSVVFTGPNVLPTNANQPPLHNTRGTRLMWYADKAAFRAGQLESSFSTLWNKELTGKYSFGMGRNLLVQGDNAVAFGDSNFIYGKNSFVSGKGNFVGWDNSIVAGYKNYVYTTSYVFGEGNFGAGFNSFATGTQNKTMNDNTFAAGFDTKANNFCASAFGFGTIANGYASFAAGIYNDSITGYQGTPTPSSPLFMIGNGTGPTTRNNALSILHSGKVGVNTSTPQSLLHLKAYQSNEDAHIRLEASGASTQYASIFYDASLFFRTFGGSDFFFWRSKEDNKLMSLDSEGNLEANGHLKVRSISFEQVLNSINTNAQIVDVTNVSYLRLSSTSTPANRTLILTDGSYNGQILIIECTADSSKGFRLIDNPTTNNTNTNGILDLLNGDTVELIWNGTDWLQTSFSNN